ncbi:LysR family transcriptional regulator [Marinimicrobium agarilyticum]|uniref:LysR family transcriptional regulator n=1 Tax=Marinimicrobium agarilyticum TaxID=306546 RepID=UPI0003F73544|nr:LysR family transcriptional regulator [Marinimicrobium agarilyticum]
MDWNALKVFLAVEHTGSLAGAARELGVNHSTVFRRLNAFEDSLGVRLFERLPTGYQLTPLGEEMLELARSIESGFGDLDRRIAGRDVQPRGRVRITAPNNIAYRYLPRYLADFRTRYPDIRIELLVSNLELNMTNRQADIAVRATSSPPPEHLVGRLVKKLDWGVYASPAYLRRWGTPRDLEVLRAHQSIGATGGMRSLPAFVWQESHLAETIVARADDLVAMAGLAESGQGLALLPSDQAREGLESVLPFHPGKTSNLWLLTHPDLRNVERIRLVMQHLATEFESDSTL